MLGHVITSRASRSGWYLAEARCFRATRSYRRASQEHRRSQPVRFFARTSGFVACRKNDFLSGRYSCFSRSSEMSSPVTFTLLLTDSFNKSECHFTTCLLATLSENTTSLSKTHLELQATASWATSRTVSRFCHMCSTTTRHGHSTSYTGVS